MSNQANKVGTEVIPIAIRLKLPYSTEPAILTGGFVPREPPILETFYNNGYHTTEILDLAVGTSVPSITNPPKTNEDNCISKGREYHHGELVSEPEECVMCLCFFGDIVCQPPKCPQLNPGCHRLPSKDPTICCGHVICENVDSPTVVLDRIDVTSNPSELITVAEGIATPDPFKDVIRTEPAPDLQSLIGDMIPFLQRLTSTSIPTAVTTTVSKITPQKNLMKSTMFPLLVPLSTSTTRTPVTSTTQTIHLTTQTDIPEIEQISEAPKNQTKDYDEGFSFDKVLQFLFSEEEEVTTKIYEKGNSTSTSITPVSDILESRIVNQKPVLINSNDEITEKNKFNYKINKTQQIYKQSNKTVEFQSYKITTVPSVSVTDNPKTTSSSSELPSISPQNYVTPLSTKIEEQNSQNMIDASSGIGLLKLAGCNIYGRMYRVGKIISELSGPCLECMCTNVGVQCRPLAC